MTTPNHTASIDAELSLKIQLGPQIIAYRPAARTESGSSWKVLDEDTDIGISAPCILRVRLVAYDQAGDLLVDPPWTINAASQVTGGTWESLPDESPATYDHLTGEYVISYSPRTYRFTVGLRGSTLSTTFELVVAQHDPATDDDDDHDIIFDPDGDLMPPNTPVGESVGGSSLTLLASG